VHCELVLINLLSLALPYKPQGLTFKNSTVLTLHLCCDE